jgi:hypothetical protein
MRRGSGGVTLFRGLAERGCVAALLAALCSTACSSNDSRYLLFGHRSSGGAHAVDGGDGGAESAGAKGSGGSKARGGSANAGGLGSGSGGLASGNGGIPVGNGGTPATSGGSSSGGVPFGTGGRSGSGGDAAGTGGVPAGAGGNCGTNTVDPTTFPACATCTGGRCIPSNLFTPAQADLLSPCDSTSRCVPEQIVAQAQNLLLKPCSYGPGIEGRCTSLCIPSVSNVAPYLPQDVCTANERCVPCFSPADGTPTGICGVGCDSAPEGQPFVFGHCCAADGRCAPKASLPAAIASLLGPETCTGEQLCVPAAMVENPSRRFTCCMASSSSGVCAPACVTNQNAQGRFLTQGNCSTGERCVPCANPLTGAPTGACSDGQGQPTTTCVP